MRKRTKDILFWLLAACAAALVGLFGLVLAGVIPLEARSEAQTLEPSVAATTAPRTEPLPAATTIAERAPVRLAKVTVTATRGSCWLEARAGSATGRTLEAARTLLEGESVTVRAPAVWLSLGATGNVDVTVNGRPRRLPFGTVAVVLRPRR